MFGPGVGECVVVGLPSGGWWVIDSCRSNQGPVALSYLDAVGVESAQVRGIVCTHWHDDHHDGVAEVLESSPNARFYCSAALQTRQFLELAATARQGRERESGLDEFGRVLSVLGGRSPGRAAATGPEWLSEGQRFDGGDPSAELWALSPSAAARTLAMQSIGELVPSLRSPKRRLVAESVNGTSVAIFIKSGDRAVLLGSDLEREPDERLGWSAVFSNHGNVGGRAVVHKVAHHGSANGDHSRLGELLVPDPVSVVTPYRPSRLPRESDLDRIARLGGDLWLTAPAEAPKLPPRANPVDRTLRECTRDRRAVVRQMGMVRARIGQGVQVEAFGSASLVRSSVVRLASH